MDYRRMTNYEDRSVTDSQFIFEDHLIDVDRGVFRTWLDSLSIVELQAADDLMRNNHLASGLMAMFSDEGHLPELIAEERPTLIVDDIDSGPPLSQEALERLRDLGEMQMQRPQGMQYLAEQNSILSQGDLERANSRMQQFYGQASERPIPTLASQRLSQFPHGDLYEALRMQIEASRHAYQQAQQGIGIGSGFTIPMQPTGYTSARDYRLTNQVPQAMEHRPDIGYHSLKNFIEMLQEAPKNLAVPTERGIPEGSRRIGIMIGEESHPGLVTPNGTVILTSDAPVSLEKRYVDLSIKATYYSLQYVFNMNFWLIHNHLPQVSIQVNMLERFIRLDAAKFVWEGERPYRNLNVSATGIVRKNTVLVTDRRDIYLKLGKPETVRRANFGFTAGLQHK